MRFCTWLVGALLWTAISQAAGPRVDVIAGPHAPPLERLAAEELQGLLKRLFDIDAKLADVRPQNSQQVILVGSPQTNPSIQGLNNAWPAQLPAQGHVLRSVKRDGGSTLIVGGGSPSATIWAVSELAHHWGVRSFLFGDLYPVAAPEFTLDGVDIVRVPDQKNRTWSLRLDTPLGQQLAGLEDQQQLVRQLAKLKFNQLRISPPNAMPIYRVDGDTAGRGAFKGAKQLDNPDLAGKTNDQERASATKLLIQGISDASRDVAINVVLEQPEDTVPTLSALPSMSFTQSPHAQIGDLDLWAYYASRTAFGEKLTPEQACHQLVTPVCGEEVSTRVWKAFAFLQQATALIQEHEPTLALPAADMLLKHQTSEPAPTWWTQVRDLYLNSMNEMYRANTRAREGGRIYTLYFARRSEFAMSYMNCLLAVRKAGAAKAMKDAETRLTELESAVEALYGALNAMAAVARSSSDRGCIAVLNEYAYRPLKRELEAAEDAASQ